MREFNRHAFDFICRCGYGRHESGEWHFNELVEEVLEVSRRQWKCVADRYRSHVIEDRGELICARRFEKDP